MKEKLKQCFSWSGRFFLCLVISLVFSAFFASDNTYAVIGGDGTAAGGTGGGGNIGGAVVHYKYKSGFSGTTQVGMADGTMGSYTTTVSADCVESGGFWHVEWVDTTTKEAYGSAKPSSALAAWSNNTTNYPTPITVNPNNYKSSDVVVDYTSNDPLELRKAYITIYNNKPTDLNSIPFAGNMADGTPYSTSLDDTEDWDVGFGQDSRWGGSGYSGSSFVNGNYTWFCGSKDGTTEPTETYVSPRPTTTVKPAGSDYTGSGTSSDPYTFSSTGDKTINFTFKVKRDDSVSESGSKFKYIGRTYLGNIANANKKNETEKSNQTITNGGSKSFDDALSVTVSENDSPQQICGKTWSYYNKWNGTSWSNPIAWNTKAGRTHQKCIYVQGPRTVRNDVTFSGSIGIVDPDYAFEKSVEDGKNYWKGDGVTESYKVQSRWTLRRTDSKDDPLSICTNIATNMYVSNDSSRNSSGHRSTPLPTVPSTVSGLGCVPQANQSKSSLKEGETSSWLGGEKTISVPVGTSKDNPIVVCYHMGYISKMTIKDASGIESPTTKAADEACVYLYNEPDETSAAFSGRTTGLLDSNSKLQDLSSGARTTMRLKYGQSGGTFMATFTHYMTWLNPGAKSWLTSVQSRWQVQESVNGGSWVNVSGRSGTKTFSNGTEVSVNSNSHSLTLNSSNLGKYVTYCQRLRYDGSTNYQSAAGGGATRVSWGSKLDSTKACVTLLNPRWEDTEKNEHITTINVNGQTTGDSMGDGAVNVGGSSYQMKKLTATALFDHSLRRWFDGWDETGVSGGMSKLCNASGGACGSTTMFSSAYNVTTRFSGVGTGLADSSLAPIGASSGRDYLPLTFVSNGKNHSDVLNWYSDATKGRTETLLGATKPKAGQSGDLCHAEHNEPAQWEVKYKEVWQVESYDSDLFGSGGILAGRTPEEHYKHTRLKSSSPEAVSGSRFTANPARCVSVERKWNYMTTSMKPGDRDGDDVVVAGDLIKRSFEVTIERDTGWDDVDRDTFGFEINREYITSISQEKTSAKLVTFVINPRPESTDKDSYLHTIEDGVMGDSNYGSSDYCRFFKDKLGGLFDDGNCQVINDVELTADPSNNMGFGDTASSLTSYSPTIEKDGISVPNLAVGAKFCVAAVIDDKSSTSTNAFISAADCQNVSKKPSVHVWGGSVQSEGGISTNKSTVEEDGRKSVYGSWADIGVIARGKINAMSSGRALVYRKSLDGGSFVNKLFKYVGNETGSISPLTLANSSLESNKYLGGYTTLTNQPDLYSAINGKYSLDSGTNSAVTVDADGVLTQDEINTLLSTPGAHIVYGGSGKDMVIEGNVVLSGSYSNASGIPYIMVVADGDILISEAVTRVDAWLVAKRNVETCAKRVGSTWKAYIDNLGEGVSDGDGLLLSAWTCKEQLVINGPVYGNAINLKRTAFADNKEGNIAEEAERTSFDITSLLFSASQADGGVPNITYVKKMAPRY